MLVTFVVVTFLCLNWAAPIKSLPGYKGDRQSFGDTDYIDVGQGKNLFYWLVEADTNPEKAPLVIWFNGGPGCSSMAGFFLEHGPFQITPAGQVVDNDLAWNRHANVLYVESPAGVGFSYFSNPESANTDDDTTTKDAVVFLSSFLAKFPQYVGRPTWLSGESYAGRYVPNLALALLQSEFQLAGLFIGNPVFECDSLNNNATQLGMFYWHGLVSYSVYGAWTAKGCASVPSSTTVGECAELYNTAVSQIGDIDQVIDQKVTKQPNLDPDDLYMNFCDANGTLDTTSTPLDECRPQGLSYLDTYLDRADVQAALHVNRTTLPGGKWQGICSAIVNYTSGTASMIPVYQQIRKLSPDISILIYSGDVDIATVPFGFTAQCLQELAGPSQTTKQVWNPWLVNGATAGYWEEFSTHAYATVKGAGHTVPSFQPLVSQALFERWILNQSLTDTQLHSFAVERKRSSSLSDEGSTLRRHRAMRPSTTSGVSRGFA